MSLIYEHNLTHPEGLKIEAAAAEFTEWQGNCSIKLTNGLVTIPDITLENAWIEVLIGVEGPAYPGLAFRVVDPANHELAYAVPHVSGKWDALQYDPVFLGSNTWQLYHGEPYQRAEQLPMDEWFKFNISFAGDRAAIWVNDREPLIVERLARTVTKGSIGFWTYLPAHFRDLKVHPPKSLPDFHGITPVAPPNALKA